MTTTTRPPEPDIDLTGRIAPRATSTVSEHTPGRRTAADWIWGLTRVALGWIFLWPFLDKTFGLGYATAAEDAWIDGGSPTFGFLTFATKGPFDGFFQSFAGEAWADWFFMIGLLGIGVALLAGVAVRIAAVSGALMLVLMWMAVLPPEHNPAIDDHIIYAMVLIGLAAVNAGDHLGLGRWWQGLDIVQRFPALR